jgi:hypothetical protein
MNATVDTILVIAAIVGALGFLARGFFRKGKKDCGSGCCTVAKKPAVSSKR